MRDDDDEENQEDYGFDDDKDDFDQPMDIEELELMNAYMRRPPNTTDTWKPVDPPHRANRPSTALDLETPRKRALRSPYVPARHTTWKPAWLDSIQCYPVNQSGTDMSDVEELRGDEVYRNTEKMRRILEGECMYVTSAGMGDLIEIAEDTVRYLKRARTLMEKDCVSKVRIERHQFRTTARSNVI